VNRIVESTQVSQEAAKLAGVKQGEVSFRAQLSTYHLWKTRLVEALEAYQQWLDSQKLTTEADLDLFEALEIVRAELAKIRGDEELLEKSGLPALAAFLCSQVLPKKQEIIQRRIESAVGALIKQSYVSITRRLEEARQQLAELHTLRGKNVQVVLHMMEQCRRDQATWHEYFAGFQLSNRLVRQQAAELLETLSMDALEELIATTHKNMMESWTTSGLRRGMKEFFDRAASTLELAALQGERIRNLIVGIYRRSEQQNMPVTMPDMPNLRSFSAKLERLHREGEAFRNSPITAITEQGFLIRKFFDSLVRRVRDIFDQASQTAEAWLGSSLNPLEIQIKKHKRMLEQRVDTLKRISETRACLDAQIFEQTATCDTLKEKLTSLANIRDSLYQPLPTVPPSEAENLSCTEAG
jgi:hypothetical protein